MRVNVCVCVCASGYFYARTCIQVTGLKNLDNESI